ncbi:MAG: NADH-quinone oxidoreductase subunit C [Bacteroidota bacterium]
MSSIQINEYQEIEDFVLKAKEYAGELTIEVRADSIVEVSRTLRDKFGFDYLADITAVDYYTDELRFGVAYNLCNLTDRKRLRISVRVEEDDPVVDSVIDVWQAANWFERECWDMMGIHFAGHPDLRRIYMPEDFEYFPLRKEFPLIGIPGSIQTPEPAPPKEYK